MSITVLSLAEMMLVGQGCGQSEDINDDKTEIESKTEDDGTQASSETIISENRERMLSRMNLDKVAEMLDIGQQTFDNAITQARNSNGE